jgi:hypothetical protein
MSRSWNDRDPNERPMFQGLRDFFHEVTSWEAVILVIIVILFMWLAGAVGYWLTGVEG